MTTTFSAADVDSLIGVVRLRSEHLDREALREALNTAAADYCANLAIYDLRRASLAEVGASLSGSPSSLAWAARVLHRMARKPRGRPKTPKRVPDRALDNLFRELESVFFDFFQRKPHFGFSEDKGVIEGPFVRFMESATRMIGLQLTRSKIRERYRRMNRRDKFMGVWRVIKPL